MGLLIGLNNLPISAFLIDDDDDDNLRLVMCTTAFCEVFFTPKKSLVVRIRDETSDNLIHIDLLAHT